MVRNYRWRPRPPAPRIHTRVSRLYSRSPSTKLITFANEFLNLPLRIRYSLYAHLTHVNTCFLALEYEPATTNSIQEPPSLFPHIFFPPRPATVASASVCKQYIISLCCAIPMTSDQCREVNMNKPSNNMWAWVINLKHRTDRWQRMVEQAKQHKLVLIRHPAVNPSAGDFVSDEHCVTQWETTLNSNFDGNYVPGCILKMSNGERGCALSHIQLWQKVCARNAAL